MRGRAQSGLAFDGRRWMGGADCDFYLIAGGRVFADLSTKLTHHGTFSFHSDPWVGVLDVQNGRLRQGFAG